MDFRNHNSIDLKTNYIRNKPFCFTRTDLLFRGCCGHSVYYLFTLFFLVDCTDLLVRGYTSDGIYLINPDGTGAFLASCDMSNGRWTIIQKRVDGSTDFHRGWSEYVAGFGDLCTNFWMGLDNIHAITSHQPMELLVTMETFEDEAAEAHYSSFTVNDAASGYQLLVSGYSGTAGDSMAYHNHQKFSTYDNDQDGDTLINCAEVFEGAWWYHGCHLSNPNGLYLPGVITSYHANGVVWQTFKGYYYSLKTIVFKVKRQSPPPR